MKHLLPSGTVVSGHYRLPITLVVFGFFGLVTLLYGVLFIRNFSGPLAQSIAGDIDQWEYMGYYVAQNLSFTPLPHIDWINDQTLYPYGTNQVFQGWAFEQNEWYALWFSLFGTGPWLNIYYLLSLFTLGTGTYLLLQTNYGPRRALVAGVLITFFNFYALNKYPDHFAYAIIHWTGLSIITDFLLARRIVMREPVSLQFILLKGVLLMLCLGQDVGYILGYALSSFTLNSLFVIGVVSWRLLTKPTSKIYVWRLLINWRQQWQRRTLLHVSLLLATVAVGLLYVPLLIEIVQQTSQFEFPDRFAGGHGWVHPARFLLPYLPGFNALKNPFIDFLHDMPEGNGAGSPGWLFMILGVVGWWKTPQRIRWAYLPLIILGLLHALYHPIRMPLLQIFPWCRFNRIPARITVVYPIVLTIFAIHWRGRIRPGVLLGLVGLGMLEAFTVYSFRYEQKPYYFAASFKPYMERVRQQPGEAVLDWPFCVVGGNSVGVPEGMCPLYNRNNTLYALKRFHGKKTVGQYYGRLHQSQLQPFVQAGWPALLNHPDTTDFWEAKHLTTCLTADQWRFFDQFYEYNDFAGINLCVDLLPASCVSTFYRHFGKPVAATEVPGIGHLVFIPKSAALRRKINRRLGQAVRLACACSTHSY